MWDELELAPVVFIDSAEDVYAERATERLKTLARQANPSVEITVLDAQGYSAGELAMLTTPSLFGEPRMVIIPNLEQLNQTLQTDLLRYIEAPEFDVTLVLRKNKGQRGKKVVDELKKAGVPTTKIAEVKSARDKTNAVMADVRAAGRRMTSDAIGALIEAVGSDLRELLSAVRQLLADVEGTIETEHVHTYFAGRIEAKGFNVADALVVGQVGKAVELARHALATGASPVAIVAAIAAKLRTMAQVLGSRSHTFDTKVSLVPWMADRAKRDLRGWSAEGLAAAIAAIARADADVKGGSRDPGYALERGILEVGRARRIK